MIEKLSAESAVKLVDDVFVGDFWDRSAYDEEVLQVQSNGLIVLLSAEREVMSCGSSTQGSLEVFDESLLEIIPDEDGVRLQAVQPRERCWMQGHWEV